MVVGQATQFCLARRQDTGQLSRPRRQRAALAYTYSRDDEVEVRQARVLAKNEAVAINLGEQGFRHQLYSH
jgi:hypothetical protein